MNRRIHMPFAGRLLAATLVAMHFAAAAHAQWKDGPVCLAPALADHASMTPDGAGGVIVVWEDARAGGGACDPGVPCTDIYAQRVDSSGVARWGASGVPVCVAAGYQGEAHVVPDGNGGWVVVWSDGRDGVGAKRLYWRRLDADGNPQSPADGTAFTSGPSNPGNLTVLGDGDGGAFVAWADWGDGAAGVWAQHLAHDGATWGTDVVIDTTTSCRSVDCSGETHPVAATDGSGGWFVTWLDRTAATIYAQRLDGQGTSAWAASVAVGHSERYPAITAGASGDAIVVWPDSVSGVEQVLGQRLSAAGAPQWIPASGIQISTGDPGPFGWSYSLVSGSSGSTIVSLVPSSGTAQTLRVFAGGMVDWSLAVGGNLASDEAGGAIAFYGAKAWRVSGTGSLLWHAGGVSYTDYYGTEQGISDGAGGAFVLAVDFIAPHDSLLVTHIRADGTTPALAAFVSARCDAAGVTLNWYSPQSVSATVYRRGATAEWTRVAVVESRGDGGISYRDAAVEPGARYGYRLGIRTAAGERFLGETWITVPVSASLALGAPQPNPAPHGFTVTFSLPGAGPASLALVDAAGRIVAARRWDAAAAGTHAWTVQGAELPPPGIYFVRMTQDGRSVSRSLCIVR